MLFAIPLAALLIVAVPIPAPAVAPLVGEEVAVVAHLDLEHWEGRKSLRRVLGALADEEDVGDVANAVNDWLAALKKAGAKDLFLLIDPADIPGLPVAVVPLTAGADARAIGNAFTGGVPRTPLRWPSSETVRGAVVAGTLDGVARTRRAEPLVRPELAAAMAAGGDTLVHVLVLPSMTQRRAIEEALPTLPGELGGGPVTTVTRGLRWASLTLTLEPRPTLRAVIQAKDADAAQGLQTIVRNGFDLLVKQTRQDPTLAVLAEALGRIRPDVEGDQVRLEADLEKAAALVSVPARKAREAARRAQCMNHLKQFGLAMHNYHQAHNAFPPAYSSSKDGEPLLSWRVHILPFIDEQALYNQFHLDEPWDSPHNAKLISQMPKIYACPSGSPKLATGGKTSYLTPRGPVTIFPGAEGVKIQEIVDGSSNTLFVVDVGDDAVVTWTRPDDWNVTPSPDVRALLGHHPGGTNVGFADGAARFLRDTITRPTLKALVTRNGGEVVDPEGL